MADQVRNLPVLHVRNDGAIVRPLPTVPAEKNAGARRDAGSVMAGMLFPVDPGWFDTFWYREKLNPRPSRLSKAVRQLWSKLSAAPCREPVMKPYGEPGGRRAHNPGTLAQPVARRR